MVSTPRISDAEWEVMRVLWRSPDCSAQEVIQALPADRGWSDRTVKSLLSRLVRKGAVRFEVEGNRYLYCACVQREDCIRAESESFLQRVFGGEASPLLAYLVRDRRLTAEERAALEQLLADDEAET